MAETEVSAVEWQDSLESILNDVGSTNLNALGQCVSSEQPKRPILKKGDSRCSDREGDWRETPDATTVTAAGHFAATAPAELHLPPSPSAGKSPTPKCTAAILVAACHAVRPDMYDALDAAAAVRVPSTDYLPGSVASRCEAAQRANGRKAADPSKGPRNGEGAGSGGGTTPGALVQPPKCNARSASFDAAILAELIPDVVCEGGSLGAGSGTQWATDVDAAVQDDPMAPITPDRDEAEKAATVAAAAANACAGGGKECAGGKAGNRRKPGGSSDAGGGERREPRGPGRTRSSPGSTGDVSLASQNDTATLIEEAHIHGASSQVLATKEGGNGINGGDAASGWRAMFRLPMRLKGRLGGEGADPVKDSPRQRGGDVPPPPPTPLVASASTGAAPVADVAPPSAISTALSKLKLSASRGATTSDPGTSSSYDRAQSGTETTDLEASRGFGATSSWEWEPVSEVSRLSLRSNDSTVVYRKQLSAGLEGRSSELSVPDLEAALALLNAVVEADRSGGSGDGEKGGGMGGA